MQRETSQAAATIAIENLTKDYGDVRAVDGLNLSISEAKVFGLLGPNGSGKTTTINCLTGLVEPTSGSASTGGFDAWKQRTKARSLLGVCPQETALYQYLTAKENVSLFGELCSVPK